MTPIFHITHFRNLVRIIESGCLWCDNLAAQRGASPVGIAHDHIKARRSRRIVPVSAGGTLADYVPFYFAPRSPMLFAIYKGNVQGYTGSQHEIVYLVSTVEIAGEQARPWCFTDGHGEIAYSEFFDNVENLGKIDWKIMKEKYWAASEEDKRRRQAEFLVHQHFSWELIRWICVHDEKMSLQVRETLGKTDHTPQIHIRPDFYFP